MAPIVIDPSVANPPPVQQQTSPDGILTATADPTYGGVLLEAQFPGAVGSWPHEVVFERVDGTRVRGGDPARSPGGFGVAYDHEAPLGVASAWRAYPVPFHHRGTPEVLGEPCQPVALDVPADLGRVWLKGVDDGRSLLVQPVEPLPQWQRAVGTTFQQVPGSRYPSATFTRRQSITGTFTFLTFTLAQRLAVHEFFDAGGPMLWQCHPQFGQHQMFVLAGELVESWTGAGDHPKRLWSVPLTEIARPVTIDSPLFIPGRSYDDADAAVESHDQAAEVWPKHQDSWRPDA